MNKKVYGYIFKTAVYKDTNLIVSVLTTSGIISFKAVSALKPTYKLHSLIQLYNFCEFELVSSDDDVRNVLIGGKILKQYSNLLSDYEANVLLSFIAETLTNEKITFNNPYLIFDNVFNNLDNKANYKNIILFILKVVLKKNGSLHDLYCCSNCGNTKNIVTVSIPNGGLICASCNNTLNLDILDSKYIEGFKHIIKANFDQLNSINLDNDVYKYLYQEMISFLDNNVGIKYNSKKLLDTLFM